MLTQWYIRVRVMLAFAVIGETALWRALKNTATQVLRTFTTNAQGRNTAPELFVGNYAHAAFLIPQLPSVHIGSDRASGRDVFGVA
jgi:hypothetical protein